MEFERRTRNEIDASPPPQRPQMQPTPYSDSKYVVISPRYPREQDSTGRTRVSSVSFAILNRESKPASNKTGIPTVLPYKRIRSYVSPSSRAFFSLVKYTTSVCNTDFVSYLDIAGILHAKRNESKCID